MNNHNLIIHQFDNLYLILNEISQDIKIKIIRSSDHDSLMKETSKNNNFLIITKKKNY